MAEVDRAPWFADWNPPLVNLEGGAVALGANLAVRVLLPGTWLDVARLWGEDTARTAVGDCWRRLGPVVVAVEEPNWSREGVVRSLGFRRVPSAVPAARDSRDGEARIEFVRGTGSLEACTGILDGRGMPLGLFWRVSSMLRVGRGIWGVLQKSLALLGVSSSAGNCRATFSGERALMC